MAHEGVLSHLVPPLSQGVNLTSPPRGHLIYTRMPPKPGTSLLLPHTVPLGMGGRFQSQTLLLPASMSRSPTCNTFSGAVFEDSASDLLQVFSRLNNPFTSVSLHRTQFMSPLHPRVLSPQVFQLPVHFLKRSVQDQA